MVQGIGYFKAHRSHFNGVPLSCLKYIEHAHKFISNVVHVFFAQVLKSIQPDRPECREKLDKILQQISWHSFPGVQALLLKGCTSSVTAETTWGLLAKLSLCVNAPVIDPSQCVGKIVLFH